MDMAMQYSSYRLPVTLPFHKDKDTKADFIEDKIA